MPTLRDVTSTFLIGIKSKKKGNSMVKTTTKPLSLDEFLNLRDLTL